MYNGTKKQGGLAMNSVFEICSSCKNMQLDHFYISVYANPILT